MDAQAELDKAHARAYALARSRPWPRNLYWLARLAVTDTRFMLRWYVKRPLVHAWMRLKAWR